MKKLTPRTLLAVAAALLMAGGAQAQKLTPGLWENTMVLKAGNAETNAGMAKLQAQLAQMPADKRKMMEEMMAQRGISMGAANGSTVGGVSVRACISTAQAERGEPPEAETRQCKRESFSRSGSTIKFKVSCSNPPSTGEGEFTMSSDKAYSGKMTMSAQVNGQPASTEIQQTGKWLSADCGDLKPAGNP